MITKVDIAGIVLLYLCITIPLKMIGSITWTWWVLLSPIWGTVAVVAILLFFSAWMIAMKGRGMCKR